VSPRDHIEQSRSTASLIRSLVPMLRSGEQSGGSGSGGRPAPEPVTVAEVPSQPVFLYQQLPVLPRNSSHQKSTPFGSAFAFRGPVTLPNFFTFFGHLKFGGT